MTPARSPPRSARWRTRRRALATRPRRTCTVACAWPRTPTSPARSAARTTWTCWTLTGESTPPYDSRTTAVRRGGTAVWVRLLCSWRACCAGVRVGEVLRSGMWRAGVNEGAGGPVAAEGALSRVALCGGVALPCAQPARGALLLPPAQADQVPGLQAGGAADSGGDRTLVPFKGPGPAAVRWRPHPPPPQPSQNFSRGHARLLTTPAAPMRLQRTPPQLAHFRHMEPPPRPSRRSLAERASRPSANASGRGAAGRTAPSGPRRRSAPRTRPNRRGE
jgi:hypothetical protein